MSTVIHGYIDIPRLAHLSQFVAIGVLTTYINLKMIRRVATWWPDLSMHAFSIYIGAMHFTHCFAATSITIDIDGLVVFSDLLFK